MNSDFLFIGHRGTRTIFDENTISAFENAIAFGANCIELDVQMCKDREIIVLHDSTLDRTTTGTGLIQNYNYNEIKPLRTKNHNQMIPLLSEVLKILKSKTRFIIEIKQDNISGDILKIVKAQKLLKDCIFSCRNLQELKKIKLKYPNIKVCYNITKGLGLNLQEFLDLGRLNKLKFKPDIINLRSNLITKEFIEVCTINNIKSLAWDFLSYQNPFIEIKSLIKAGIDGILFDDHRNIPEIRCWYDLN
ncbi:MAG: glycerophosphodiester phosphodiesterase [Promethearchaeota archaeon]